MIGDPHALASTVAGMTLGITVSASVLFWIVLACRPLTRSLNALGERRRRTRSPRTAAQDR